MRRSWLEDFESRRVYLHMYVWAYIARAFLLARSEVCLEIYLCTAKRLQCRKDKLKHIYANGFKRETRPEKSKARRHQTFVYFGNPFLTWNKLLSSTYHILWEDFPAISDLIFRNICLKNIVSFEFILIKFFILVLGFFKT